MSVKKLASTTKHITDWRASWEPAATQRSIERWLAKLEEPDVPRLRCGALARLANNYRVMAEYEQLHRGDTRACRENMYRAAWCQRGVCLWPDRAVNGSLACFNGTAMLYFLGAVIADADLGLQKELGDLLRRPEYQLDFDITAVNATLSGYRALIALALGEEETVIQAQAEKALADITGLKSVRKGAAVELRILLDILDGNETAFNEDLAESIRCERSNRDRYTFMDWHAIACAKIAMGRGMEVRVDTEDCPLSLSRPAEMDYSGLELPRPRCGFPWEQR